MLADSQAERVAGWALVQQVAARYDAKPVGLAGPEVSMQASCAKMFTTEIVGRVADRSVRLLRLYEGTTQIQQLVIGRQLMRADR